MKDKTFFFFLKRINFYHKIIIESYMLIKDIPKIMIICLSLTIFIELLSVIVEWIIYKKFLDYKRINPFVLSILLNICSYIAGEILFLLLFTKYKKETLKQSGKYKWKNTFI